MNDSNYDVSISRLFEELKAGNPQAAEGLWTVYFERLVTVARKQLGDAPKRVADEEDIALSVFQTLCVGAARGKFADHVRHDVLWHLLLHRTNHKLVNYVRRETRIKRGSGDVRGESVFLNQAADSDARGLDQIVRKEPTPSMLAALNEQHQRLLETLANDTLRRIAISRMQGETHEEIADQLKLSVRSVERKLNLIREC
ncbi:MAG: ECF-type sigma factor [Planctomycetia bacterium]|nr:ECF-type sigma factor [Planctomycetia bacterium]